jgi:hypothetical protein
MKKIEFYCCRHSAHDPEYGCSESGDNTGDYYRAEEVEPFLTVLGKILEAHEMSCVDWSAMRKATKLLREHNLGVKLGPYGCRCQTLHQRVSGSGCDICNPQGE